MKVSEEYLMKRNIEVLNRDIEGHRFKCVIFDFDGTISLLRGQWREVMCQLMIEMVSGKAEPTPQIRQEVKQYIEQSAGIQTIYQMRYLVELVIKYGLVPPEEILTAEEYKEIYDKRLMDTVDKQLAMFKDDRAAKQELMVRGVIDFLELLKSFKVTLYVMSGTDRKHVLREARALGVAHYFKGIFGPDPTLPDYSKDWVIRKVTIREKLEPNQILVVGDSPVELALAKNHGNFSIGVASIEKPGDGLDSVKRQRLLKAGADIIIPDFFNCRLLSRYLFI